MYQQLLRCYPKGRDRVTKKVSRELQCNKLPLRYSKLYLNFICIDQIRLKRRPGWGKRSMHENSVKPNKFSSNRIFDEPGVEVKSLIL